MLDFKRIARAIVRRVGLRKWVSLKLPPHVFTRVLPKGIFNVTSTGIRSRCPDPLSPDYALAARDFATKEAVDALKSRRFAYAPNPLHFFRLMRWRQLALLANSQAISRRLLLDPQIRRSP